MLVERLTDLLRSLATELGHDYPEDVLIEEPPAGFAGDLSTNLAMQLARQAKTSPRHLAEQLKERLEKQEGITAVEIAGPGFLNLTLADEWYADAVEAARAPFPQAAATLNINVEYVSANPTGPMHIGNARGGPIGETISRVLEKVGHRVVREYYVNDIGGQATVFAKSVLHFYLKEFGVETEFPEKGYPGDYVKEIAQQVAKEEGDRFVALTGDEQVEAMRVAAIDRMVAQIRTTTERMGITFDRWYFQSSLVESGLSAETFKRLQENGATLEKDGAVWLKSGVLEDDRETVLMKSNGIGTYFLDDIAYHWDKLELRKFDKAIGLLGANHFGHIPRMQAGIKAIGLEPNRYVGIMYQQVQLKRGGEVVKMAKREGNFVTADEVLDEVPLQVFNYFMLSKANETHMDFDLQLAKDTSEKNPVYYVQYAHARVASLIRHAEEKGAAADMVAGHSFSQSQRRLIYWLDRYAATVHEVAQTFRTNLVPAYVHELATRFHNLYSKERIVTEDEAQTKMLLLLSELTATRIKDCLSLMGIEALERM